MHFSELPHFLWCHRLQKFPLRSSSVKTVHRLVKLWNYGIVPVLRSRFQTEALLLSPVAFAEDDGSAQLLRTKSDAGVLRRGQRRSPSDQRKIRRHRFSINGHFYNHKVQQVTENDNKCVFLTFVLTTEGVIVVFSLRIPFLIWMCAIRINRRVPVFPLPDGSVHACLRLGDQRAHQQLHDDASGAAGSPQQVQNREQPRWLRRLPRARKWRWVAHASVCFFPGRNWLSKRSLE